MLAGPESCAESRALNAEHAEHAEKIFVDIQHTRGVCTFDFDQ
jgi:hypothetical protein